MESLWNKRTRIHVLVSAIIACAIALPVCAWEGDFGTPAQAAPASVSQSHTAGCTGTSTAAVADSQQTGR